MARFSIYSAGGVLKAQGCPTYTGTYMKPGMLDFREIGSPELIEWEVGDYVDYSRTGLRYRIYQKPQLKKQARRRTYGGAFLHQNVQLYDDSYQLQICPFRDLVVGDNRIHFSTQPQISVFDNVAGIAERIQACLEDMYGEGSWAVRVADENDGASQDLITLMGEEREFVVSGVNLLQVLDKVYEIWPEVGWIFKVEVIDDVPTNTIVIGGGGLNSTVPIYAYGKGHGLLSLQRTVANADELANRLYVYGSDKNMLPRWYNQFNIKDADSVDIQHLMLPIDPVGTPGDANYYPGWGKTVVGSENLSDPAKAFVEATGVNTSNLRPKVVYFDGSGDVGEIYPTIKNLTAGEARIVIPSGTQYRPSTTIYADSAPLDVVLTAQNPSDDGLAGNAYGKGAAQTGTDDFSDSNSGTIGAYETIEETIYNDSITAASAGKYDIEVTLSPLAPSSISGDIDGAILELDVAGQQWQLALEGGGGTWIPAQVVAKLKGVTLATSGTVAVSAKLYLDNKTNDSSESVSWSLVGTIAYKLTKTRETTFYITIPQIGFDIEAQAALGDGKSIAFLSGDCVGRTFPIKSVAYLAATDSWRLELTRIEDESLSQWFPNTDYQIAVGDKYVLLDIAMPAYLINVAENRLLAAAQDLLDYTAKEVWQYTPEIDAKFMELNSRMILPAQYIALSDTDIFGYAELSYFQTHQEVYYLTENNEKILLDGSGLTAPVLVDSVTIAEGEAQIATYKVTLRERKKKKYDSNANVPSPTSHPVASTEVTATPQPAVSSYFEEDGNGNVKLKDEWNGLWANGFMSAGGISSGGGGGGGGASLLEVWQSLTNNTSLSSYDDNTKIAVAHIPNITTGMISNLASWTGSANITTLGTVTTGVWNGTTIDVAHGGTGRTSFLDAYAVLVESSTGGIGNVTNNETTTKKFLSQTGNGAGFATNIPVWSTIGAGDVSVSGDAYGVLIRNSSGTISAISANSATTKKFLAQTGNGGGFASNSPVWSDIEIPAATSSAIGGIKTGFTTANNNYAVQLNASNQAYVYVPWRNDTYKFTLNGTTNGDSSSGTSLGSCYAPTTAGTSGYVLASNGSGAPSWINNPTFSAARLKPDNANYGSHLYFGDDAYAYIYEDTDDHLLIYADKGIKLSMGGSYSLEIPATTTIGTSASNKNLTVYGAVYVGGTTSYWEIDSYSRMHTNADVKIDGAVIVGGTSTNKDLTVFGKLRLGTTVSPAPHYLAYDSSTPAIYTDTNFYAQGFVSAGGVSSSSDERLKTNVKPIELTVAQIAKAPAVTFDWIDKTRGSSAGSIAQYWQNLLPQNVRKWGGDYLSMEYGNMALISSIIIAREVEALKRKIKELERRLAA